MVENVGTASIYLTIIEKLCLQNEKSSYSRKSVIWQLLSEIATGLSICPRLAILFIAILERETSLNSRCTPQGTADMRMIFTEFSGAYQTVNLALE